MYTVVMRETQAERGGTEFTVRRSVRSRYLANVEPNDGHPSSVIVRIGRSIFVLLFSLCNRFHVDGHHSFRIGLQSSAGTGLP